MSRLRMLACASAAILAFGAVSASADQGPVRIGVMSDMSGLYADLSGPGSTMAARMAIEDFGGELFGHPIELVEADHQNRGDLASTVAREWFDASGVDAIFDVPNSSAALAVQELARERGKYFFISGAATSRLTNDSCSPTGVHWTYDTYALANGTGRAMVAEGLDSWFFLTADYAFGHSLEGDTGGVVEAEGGAVLGTVRHPLDTQDFSSYLLQAQASGAQVIGLANAGTDTTNAIRQAAEFGIVQAGQRLAGLLLFITDVHALGLEDSQDLVLTTGFYWDRDEETRAFAARFEERMGQKPTMVHAGVYSSAMHFFRALEEAGTKDPEAVMPVVRANPVEHLFGEGAYVRGDGRMVHDMYLVRVKAPEESSGAWDYYEILRTIPGDEAFLPLNRDECPYVAD